MILSFGDEDTRRFFEKCPVARWERIEKVAMRKLYMLELAMTLDELRVPPGNRLKPLKGDYSGHHSIRINDQFRVCFIWRDGHAHAVRIVDYH